MTQARAVRATPTQSAVRLDPLRAMPLERTIAWGPALIGDARPSRPSAPGQIFITPNALRDVRAQISRDGAGSLGYFVGERFRDADSKEPWVLVDAVIPVAKQPTRTPVSMLLEATFEIARAQARAARRHVVGWYHSAECSQPVLTSADAEAHERHFAKSHSFMLMVAVGRHERQAALFRPSLERGPVPFYELLEPDTPREEAEKTTAVTWPNYFTVDSVARESPTRVSGSQWAAVEPPAAAPEPAPSDPLPEPGAPLDSEPRETAEELAARPTMPMPARTTQPRAPALAEATAELRGEHQAAASHLAKRTPTARARVSGAMAALPLRAETELVAPSPEGVALETAEAAPPEAAPLVRPVATEQPPAPTPPPTPVMPATATRPATSSQPPPTRVVPVQATPPAPPPRPPQTPIPAVEAERPASPPVPPPTRATPVAATQPAAPPAPPPTRVPPVEAEQPTPPPVRPPTRATPVEAAPPTWTPASVRGGSGPVHAVPPWTPAPRRPSDAPPAAAQGRATSPARPVRATGPGPAVDSWQPPLGAPLPPFRIIDPRVFDNDQVRWWHVRARVRPFLFGGLGVATLVALAALGSGYTPALWPQRNVQAPASPVAVPPGGWAADAAAGAVARYKSAARMLDEGRISCPELGRFLVGVEQAWITYSIERAAMSEPLDAAGVRRERRLESDVAEIEQHFRASGCPRP